MARTPAPTTNGTTTKELSGAVSVQDTAFIAAMNSFLAAVETFSTAAVSGGSTGGSIGPARGRSRTVIFNHTTGNVLSWTTDKACFVTAYTASVLAIFSTNSSYGTPAQYLPTAGVYPAADFIARGPSGTVVLPLHHYLPANTTVYSSASSASVVEVVFEEA